MFPNYIGWKYSVECEQPEDNKSTPKDWFCACENPSRAGVTLSFWEPTHLVRGLLVPHFAWSVWVALFSLRDKAPSASQATGGGSWLQKLFGGSHKRGSYSDEDANMHNALGTLVQKPNDFLSGSNIRQ